MKQVNSSTQELKYSRMQRCEPRARLLVLLEFLGSWVLRYPYRTGRGLGGRENARRDLTSTASRPRMDATGIIPRLRMTSAALSLSQASAHGFTCISPSAVNLCIGNPKISPPR